MHSFLVNRNGLINFSVFQTPISLPFLPTDSDVERNRFAVANPLQYSTSQFFPAHKTPQELPYSLPHKICKTV